MEQKPLGQYLRERGKLSEEQLQKALELQKRRVKNPPFLGELLIEMNAVRPEDVELALTDQERDRIQMNLPRL